MAAKDEQIEQLTQELKRKKEKYKQARGMNCKQLTEHDAALASKDQEIPELQQGLRNVRNGRAVMVAVVMVAVLVVVLVVVMVVVLVAVLIVVMVGVLEGQVLINALLEWQEDPKVGE